VTDVPLFEAAEGGGVSSRPHPFPAPDRVDFDPKNVEELLTLRSRAYDLVVNGEELGGGSIRINDRNLQRKIFTALGLSDEEIKDKFGFFLRAFDFGAPPHGGLALGMDRTVSMILGTPSIREVIAFPKNRSAACPLTGAPSRVKRGQLAELGLLNLGGKDFLPGTAESEDRIGRLSWVSRIGVSSGERPEIEKTLKQADDLARTAAENAGGEEPVRSAAPAANRMRPGTEGTVSDLAESGKLLKSSPSVKGNYFKVSGILD
jgi:aspartyl-tRNA synthetase